MVTFEQLGLILPDECTNFENTAGAAIFMLRRSVVDDHLSFILFSNEIRCHHVVALVG